jgi:hypothetical protein
MNPKLGQNPPIVSPTFTALQGQYLAFIHAYTCIFRKPPAEADIQRRMLDRRANLEAKLRRSLIVARQFAIDEHDKMLDET